MMNDIFEPLKKHDYITYDIARKYGISKYMFNKYIHENNLEQVEHGIYASKDELTDELYILHKRCPNAVFSHDEAFYYHGLSDREPIIHTLTIFSGYNPHRLVSTGNCKVYTIKKELLEVGKILVNDSMGNEIPMYNMERTVCDLVRNRNSIEIQEFNSVLKTYLLRKDKDLNLLMEYAKLFRLKNIIRKYMEVLL